MVSGWSRIKAETISAASSVDPPSSNSSLVVSRCRSASAERPIRFVIRHFVALHFSVVFGSHWQGQGFQDGICVNMGRCNVTGVPCSRDSLKLTQHKKVLRDFLSELDPTVVGSLDVSWKVLGERAKQGMSIPVYSFHRAEAVCVQLHWDGIVCSFWVRCVSALPAPEECGSVCIPWFCVPTSGAGSGPRFDMASLS